VTTPAPPRKPTYRTFVAERHLDVPRDSVWSAVVGLLDAGEIGPAASGIGVERVLSLEPPWRRSARLEVGAAGLGAQGLVEHTVAIRDDGATCHLVWSYLVEQPDEQADAPAVDAFDRLLEALASSLSAACDAVARAVKAG
jgi:hypothetical protein